MGFVPSEPNKTNYLCKQRGRVNKKRPDSQHGKPQRERLESETMAANAEKGFRAICSLILYSVTQKLEHSLTRLGIDLMRWSISFRGTSVCATCT